MKIVELVKNKKVDIQTGPFGTQLKASEYVDNGTPVLNVKNLGFGRVRMEALDHIGADTLKRLQRHILHTGDIVFGRKGAVDRYAYISSNEDGWMQGSDCIRMRVLSADINPRYLAYYFLTPYHKAFMRNMCSHGTTMASLNQKILEQIDFPMVERSKQDRIVSILTSMDELMQSNERINKNLEAQAFSYFDYLQDITTGTCSIKDIADLNPTRTIKKGDTARYIGMSDLSTSVSFPDSWSYTQYKGGMKFVNGDTILARITPCLENGKTAYIGLLNPDETAFGSTEYIVLSPKDGIPAPFLYCMARNKRFRDFAIKNMNGTSGRQRVSATAISSFELKLPSESDLQQFEAFATSAFQDITNNGLENQKLAMLRDTLLPKLMSGEIDVSGIDL